MYVLVEVRPGHLLPQGPRNIPSAQPLGRWSYARRPVVCKVGCHQALCTIQRKSLPAGFFLVGLEELPERIQFMTMWTRKLIPEESLENVCEKIFSQLSNMLVEVIPLPQGHQELGALERRARSWKDCWAGSPCRKSLELLWPGSFLKPMWNLWKQLLLLEIAHRAVVVWILLVIKCSSSQKL